VLKNTGNISGGVLAYARKAGRVRNKTLVFLLLLPVLPTLPAGASVIFNNYPISGVINAVAISGLFNGTPISASDSFTLGSGATVDGVNFGVWLNPGSVFNKVNWVISTEPFGTGVLDAFQQGANVTTTVIPDPSVASVVASASFAFPDLHLAAGTYYLTLQGAAFWDINNTAGIDAWQTGFGQLSAPGACSQLTGGLASGSCAESFQILGVSDAPEPSTLILLGSALILAAIVVKRKAVTR
jgi:hypothetical protein